MVALVGNTLIVSGPLMFQVSGNMAEGILWSGRDVGVWKGEGVGVYGMVGMIVG